MTNLPALILAQSALWLVLVGAIAIGFLLLSRVRQLYRQIAPLGALAPLGDNSTSIAATPIETLSGTIRTIGGQHPHGKTTLLAFVSGTCPVSRKMSPIIQDFCNREHLDYLFIGDDTDTAQRKALRQLGVNADRFANNLHVGRLVGADRVPFAALIDDQGMIAARGLVNNREHLESLLAARDTGFGSIQAYLDAHPTALARA